MIDSAQYLGNKMMEFWFVLEFYGPVNEVMSGWSVNSGTVPGQAKIL